MTDPLPGPEGGGNAGAGPAGQPVEQPAGRVADDPAGQPGEHLAGRPVDPPHHPAEQPADHPDKPAEQLAEKPDKPPVDSPAGPGHPSPRAARFEAQQRRRAAAQARLARTGPIPHAVRLTDQPPPALPPPSSPPPSSPPPSSPPPAPPPAGDDAAPLPPRDWSAEATDEKADDEAPAPSDAGRPSESTEIALHLRVIDGSAGRTDFELRPGQYHIGRHSKVDVPLDGPSVSRWHARIHVDPKQVTIEDLGSRNGTTVNGERLEGPRPLHSDDRIQLGEALIEVVLAPET